MSTSRWLTWTPPGKVIEKHPQLEPPKPPKPSFEGFAGVVPIGKQKIDGELAADVAIETACCCSKWSFPHIHSRGDREHAIREWNRDSRHKVEWIQ